MKGEDQTQFRVIFSTAPDRDTARKLAHLLVSEHLAACVNLVPGLESIYQWEGKVDSAEEVLLIIKTTASRTQQTLAALADAHPYEVPEGIVLNVEAGLEKYLAWLEASTR